MQVFLSMHDFVVDTRRYKVDAFQYSAACAEYWKPL